VDGFWRKHWLTALSLLMAAFMLFLAVAFALDTEGSSTARTTGAVVFGISGLVLLSGLWLLRSGGSRAAAYTLIVVPTLWVGAGFFWMLLIPTALAFVIIFFGVFRGGLVRELGPSPSAPATAT
jgi:hypothetical protein